MRMKSAVIAVLGTTLAGTALAQSPADISDLVGARAAGGETQMQNRGYVNVGAETGDDRVWTYWWNSRTQTCVTVATMNGRYDAITISPSPDCQRGGAQPAVLPSRPGRPSTLPPQATTLPAPPMRPMPVQPDGPAWFDVGLVCFGQGQRPTLASRYGYTWDYDQGRYVYGNRTELSTQDFNASVNIQLWEGGGRIRLPTTLIPPIHSRGDHGWWELDNVSSGRNTITAEYRLNGLNKPRVNIDRRSGQISIRGTGDYAFNGTCDTVDNQQRRF